MIQSVSEYCASELGPVEPEETTRHIMLGDRMKLQMSRLALLGALILPSSAALADPIPTAPIAAEAETAQVAQATTLTVVNTGAEPQAPLRYDLANMAPQTLVMDMTMGITMSSPMLGEQQQAMPTMRMTMNTTEAAMQPDGNIRVVMQLGSYEVLNTPGVDPMVHTAMQQALADIGAFSATMVMDDRGNIISGDYDYDDSNPMIAQQMASMEDQMSNMTIPFPEEAVGVGAQWNAVQNLEMNGIQLNQTSTFTLTERTDNSVTLSVSVDQSAPQQTIPDPTTGMDMYLESMTSTGGGTSTITFAQLVPTSEVELTTEMSMSMDQGGQRIPVMDMTMTMEMTINGQ